MARLTKIEIENITNQLKNWRDYTKVSIRCISETFKISLSQAYTIRKRL